MSSRLRPLHTCGVSFLTIAHSTCSRVQNLDGRLGSTARKMVRLTKVLNSLIFVMQYLWLLFLFFVDDRLLAIANIMENTFPPSKLVFDKIDDLLHLIATFPGKFDDAVEKMPCFNQVLFLEWAVTHAISLLKSMISILMNFGRDDTSVKEILVDMNCNKDHNGSVSAEKSEYCANETISSMSETQTVVIEKMKSNTMKASYKEVLKMGSKKKKHHDECKEIEKGTDKRSQVEEARDQVMEDKEELRNNKGSTKRVEDAKSSKNDVDNNESQTAKMEETVEKAEGNHRNYEGITSNEENSEVKGVKEAGLMDYEYEAMKGSRKEVLKMGTRGKRDDDDCKENEKGTYKRSLVEGTKDRAMEDIEESENDQDSCEKGNENTDTESRTANMEESVEKTEGNEEIRGKKYEGIINKEEKAKIKNWNSETGLTNYEYEEEERKGSIENEQNILELFEAAWRMKPTGKGKENLLPRSASIV